MKLVLERGDILPKFHTPPHSVFQFHMLTETAKNFVRAVGSATFEGGELSAPFRFRYWMRTGNECVTECFYEIEADDPETAIVKAKKRIDDWNKEFGSLDGKVAIARFELIEIKRGRISHWRSWV